MTPVDLSFILCTYNGEHRLPETLRCLLAQHNPAGHAWEIVFVDNASTDNTAKVAAEFAAESPVPFRILHEPTPGKTHALVAGLKAASGRYFTLVDDDNHLCPGWLKVAVPFLDAHPDTGLLGGKILPTFDPGAVVPPDFEERFASYLAVRDYGNESKPDVRPIGAGMTGRTAILQWLYANVGSYLEDRVGKGMGSCEDHEKILMSYQLGWRSWYIPALEMRHFIPAGRLTDKYVMGVDIAAHQTLPWLEQIPGLNDVRYLPTLRMIAAEGAIWLQKVLLCLVPYRGTKWLREAPQWKRVYYARFISASALLRNRKKIARMFATLRAAPAHVRPATPVDRPDTRTSPLTAAAR